ncbi:cell cycle RNA binding protein whi3 [Kickxella alabastrina]|nr:cell cycle RNA binding protein whi3 [Kickxella alabastrina]
MMLHRRGSVHGTTPVSSSMGVSAGSGSVNNMYQQQPSMSEQGSSDSEMLQMTGQSHQLQLSPPLQAQTSAQQQQSQLPQQSQKQMPQQPPKGYGSQRPALLDIAALQPRINQLSLGQMSASTLISPMGMPYTPSAKTPMGMVLPMATTRSVNTNDQNPPCNTLYVGNLPAGAMEEELRLIFQQALGFKRMSYRAKPCSGPMCFVEFDNIDFATLAMNELDGRMLSNSVGSGIRLSYSKNPLGVRSNQPGGAPPATPVLNSAAAAAVVAAMSGGYHHINGSPYGYSMAALQQQQHLQHQQQHLQRHNATPSPPGSAMMARNTSAMTLPQRQAVGGHRHSMSSSSAASPLPSPGTAMSSGDQTAVPKDALSFLHQPIHQLHKQASNDHPISSNGSPTPPQTSANSVNHIALEQ